MFHVPNEYRIHNGPMGSDDSYGNNGAFFIPAKLPGRELWVIASDAYEFEHASVHVANRTNKLFMPNWEEMAYIKSLFWDPEDVAMQLHPAESSYVNNHPLTLHIWRPTYIPIPTPPPILVGIQGLTLKKGVGHVLPV